MENKKYHTFRLILLYIIICILVVSVFYGLYIVVNYIEKQIEEQKLEDKLERDLLCYNLGYNYSSDISFGTFECFNSIYDFRDISISEFRRFYVSNNKVELIKKYEEEKK
jgi:predicted membrane protein